MMANVHPERLLQIPAEPIPELRVPGTAAQTRVVSVSEIRLGLRRAERNHQGKANVLLFPRSANTRPP
jgi:hypothetical protein